MLSIFAFSKKNFTDIIHSDLIKRAVNDLQRTYSLIIMKVGHVTFNRIIEY